MKTNEFKNWNQVKINRFREALVSWYLSNKRILPWRENSDPYRIWVSEVMLQQTRVDTVLPYFERFMTKFKTMQDFAYAKEADILKIWEGLGYYSRVRNLQIAMRQVIEDFDGVTPSSKAELLSLKGVGPYTAGAILSIAYKQAEPAIDGNVMRVISRIFEIDEDIMKPKTRKTFETILYELIDPDAASEFNQGLMEIGALVCTPKKPMCLLCPLQEFCASHRDGRELDFPVKIKKTKSKTLELVSVIVEQDGKYLVEQRASTGLLAGLWQFPTVEAKPDENIELIKLKFMREYGVGLKFARENLAHVKHIFSHLVWEVDVKQADVEEGAPIGQTQFVTRQELAELAFSVPYQKMWQAYVNQKGGSNK
ncbi:A/G-specific adenine glycosylase [Listeria floridensis FSL S10-1187]|uniref:Adenine DNA glycosylase n=1 Tax=Listeria floridensis FSL S10-1187 TaxID=1265817 RepID=A0ABP3AWE3_9LIST|nr:A/G-specific adenine glycosylase [Listeria floridensis]EUJ29120.1 A/G-specific adenine glycosylase [Listeria floridensis FSL S10-1187]